MKQEAEFLLCKHCGNLVEMIHSAGVPILCCGQPMERLKANISEGAKEKHIPKITVKENELIVEVGENYHPMEEEHHISWVCVKSKKGCQRKDLCHNCKPVTEFAFTQDDEPETVYAYCNLHGLWKKEV